MLESCINKKTENINPTIILPIRKDADKINQINFDKLDNSKELVYQISEAKLEEMPLSNEDKESLSKVTPQQKVEAIEQLKSSIMAENNLKLRIGTQVMCIVNLDVTSGFPVVNGSQGTVIDFKEGFPVVKFVNDFTNIIRPHIWMSDIIPGVGIQQLPLIYAWAITIHKAQGLTLDTGLIDVGSGIFECGQTYVALSRVKSLEGLYLKNFDPTKIKVNKKVKEFYKNLTLE